jgi:hypothetical protein
MDKRHIIKLQGREFVTYEGLLDAAHKQGLVEIRTQLVQVPGPQTDHTAICVAEVILAKDGQNRVFTGIGDASPRNVSRNVALHLIRMAETRAKARALRDAINVGMAAIEELESADLPSEIGEGRRGEREPEVEIATRQAALDDRPASKAQIDRVGREMKRVGMTPEEGRAWLLQTFNKQSRLELTEREIAGFLEHLEALPAVPATA